MTAPGPYRPFVLRDPEGNIWVVSRSSPPTSELGG
jgi:hypothetical protein